MGIKLIPIHGIEFINDIIIPIKINEKYYSDIQFISYERYLNEVVSDRERFPRSDKIQLCDSVIAYNTQNHNTFEVINIKIVVSIIYFINRIINTNKSSENCVRNIIYDESDEFFYNYITYGYRNNSGEICNTLWYVSLGNRPVTNDNFDNLLTRVFESDIEEEELKQISFTSRKVKINNDKNFIDTLNILLNKVNDDSLYSLKIKSALRLFYDVLYHENFDRAIITYSTILETLLLDKDEDNQRKKVSVRCATIIANGKSKRKKEFIANIIYYFYKYRNNIIHDGLLSLEIDHEVIINNILSHIRNIIYFIIKNIIDLNINSISDIRYIVKSNCEQDNLSNAFNYITYSENNDSKLELIFQ